MTALGLALKIQSARACYWAVIKGIANDEGRHNLKQGNAWSSRLSGAMVARLDPITWAVLGSGSGRAGALGHLHRSSEAVSRRLCVRIAREPYFLRFGMASVFLVLLIWYEKFCRV